MTRVGGECPSRQFSIWLLAIGLSKPAAKPPMIRNKYAFRKRCPNASGLSKAAIPTGRRTCSETCVSFCANVMAVSTLIDTGAILAILDRDDHWNKLCVAAIQQLALPLMTSEAVLTEL